MLINSFTRKSLGTKIYASSSRWAWLTDAPMPQSVVRVFSCVVEAKSVFVHACIQIETFGGKLFVEFFVIKKTPSSI